jgi:hypothetical protein
VIRGRMLAGESRSAELVRGLASNSGGGIMDVM